MFGKRAAAFRAGLNTAPAGERGVVTFGAWLARREADGGAVHAPPRSGGAVTLPA
jgi:hypothetical protein